MTIKFLTTMDTEYHEFLVQEAQKHGLTRRAILEKAIDSYKVLSKQKSIEESYKKMGNDKDYLKEMQDNSSYLSYL